MEHLIEHFKETILSQKGKIADNALTRKTGFICAALPLESEIQPGDILMGGLAIQKEEESLHLYSYLLREICSNGAVSPVATRKSSYSETDSGIFEVDLDFAIQALKENDLAAKANRFYKSLFEEADPGYMRQVSFMVFGITGDQSSRQEVYRRALLERRRSIHASRRRVGVSRFDVINAVTELARDTQDPDKRWRLMRLGGDLLEQDAPETQKLERKREVAVAGG